MAVGLSLFPLSAPMTLPIRTVISEVPAGQIGATLSILVFLGVSAVGDLATESAQTTAATKTEAATEGFIDKSGIIENIPTQVPEEVLKPFASEASARRALETGKYAHSI